MCLLLAPVFKGFFFFAAAIYDTNEANKASGTHHYTLYYLDVYGPRYYQFITFYQGPYSHRLIFLITNCPCKLDCFSVARLFSPV
jgi:hypothetical protein